MTGPTPVELDEMKALGAATLFHGQGERGAVDPAIKPISFGMRLSGPALTVDVPPGDNLAMHLAIAKAAPGDVIVVDYKGHMDVAVTGDIMALAAKTRGVAGFVVDGAVRDAEDIAEMDFPVFARGLSIKGPSKDAPGTVGEPIRLGGIDVQTGDYIVGDADGIVVIAQDSWAETLENARAREAKEAGIRRQFAHGKTTVELLGLEEPLKRHGMHL
ncbi:MAG: RraA family protein [Pseudomonadota bacterium]